MTDHPLAIEFGLNSEQAPAATIIDRHVCVEAGAGSGKTRVLVARLAGLLEPGRCSLDEVAAITFTRKAASEMRKRLREAFRTRATSPHVGPDEQSHWRELIRRLETARINTIDGFCASILREHAVSLGIDPDFTVLDESETILFRDEIVRAEMMQLLEEHHPGARCFAEEFGVDQLVESVMELVRSSRKLENATRSLPMDDAAALLDRWREQAEIEARQSIARFVQENHLESLKDYLESLSGECRDASDTLETHRLNFLESVDVLLDAPTRSSAATAIAALCSFKRNSGRKDNWGSGLKDELCERLGALCDCAKALKLSPFDELVERRASEMTVHLFSVYRRAITAYQDAKRRTSAMDFGDLLSETVSAVAQNDGLRRQLRASFKHILIDEFQDTDPVQFELVELLRGTPDDPGANIFIVGDVKQSIYGFRGADVDVFEQAKAASKETIPLALNYRSDPAILEFVNAFYNRSGRLTSAARTYQALIPHRAMSNSTRIEFVVPEDDPGKPKSGEYRRREAALVAQRLASLCTGGARVWEPADEAFRDARFGDAAILFRKSGPIAEYEQVLREWNIPFVIEQGRGYFDRQEIHDVTNLLTFIANPWDETALVGFLRSPLAALSDESLMELATHARLAQAFYGAEPLEDPDQNLRLVRARELVRRCHELRHAPVVELLHLIYEQTGFEAAQLALHHAVQRASNVRKLLDSAENISASRISGLHAFIRYVSDVHAYELVESEAPLVNDDSGAVTLMTAHKSKGLEFPIVVLADSGRTVARSGNNRPIVLDRDYGLACAVEDDKGERAKPVVFEMAASREQERELAEEARLLYVAMTRAKDHLLIAGAPGAMKNSWLSWLDEEYGVLAAADGSVITVGEGNASVHRIGGATAPPTEPDRRASIDVDALAHQAAPLPASDEWQSIGVDRLLDLLENEAKPDFGPSDSPAMAVNPLLRGQIVHKFFEEWDFSAAPEYDRILEPFELSDDGYRMMRDYLEESRLRFENSSLFGRCSRCDGIRKELPFIAAIGDHVVSGVVDVLLPDGTMIDYKSGAPTPRRLERYTRQLHLYAAALRAVDSALVSGACVYYVDTGDIVEIDLSPEAVGATLEQLERVFAPRKHAG